MENELLSVIHTAENLLSRADALVEIISSRREEVRRLLQDVWAPKFKGKISIRFQDEESDDYDEESFPMISSNGKVNYYIDIEDEACAEMFTHSISALLLNLTEAEHDVRAQFSYVTRALHPRTW